MAKITRKKLARGTKLQVDQMHGPMSDTATQLSAGRSILMATLQGLQALAHGTQALHP